MSPRDIDIWTSKFSGSWELIKDFLNWTFLTKKFEYEALEQIRVWVFIIRESRELWIHSVYHWEKNLWDFYIQTNFIAPYIGFLWVDRNVQIFDYSTGLQVWVDFSDYFTHPSLVITPEIFSEMVYTILDSKTGKESRIKMYTKKEMQLFYEKYWNDLYDAPRHIRARCKEILNDYTTSNRR